MALLSFHPLRWKVWTPCRNRVHPQRGGPRVRERNRGGRGSAAKAADCPDQTSRRTPKGLQLERPPFQHQWGQDRHLSPQHTCPLSLVSALTESVDAPHFSSTKAKKKNKTKNNKHCSKTVFVGSVAMEWGGLKGMDENHTHTLITFCGQPGGAVGMLASTPLISPRFRQEGWKYLSLRRHLSLIAHTQLSLLVLLSSLLVS